MDGVRQHQEFLARDQGKARRAARYLRVRQEFLELLKEGVFRHLVQQLIKDGRLYQIVQEIMEKRTDPYSACEALVRDTLEPG
jgi:hypothetical protein